jgi:hypothetical protein
MSFHKLSKATDSYSSSSKNESDGSYSESDQNSMKLNGSDGADKSAKKAKSSKIGTAEGSKSMCARFCA